MFKEGGSVKSWKKRFVVIWDSYIEYMEAEDSKKPKGVICTFSFLAFVVGGVAPELAIVRSKLLNQELVYKLFIKRILRINQTEFLMR